MIFSQCFGSFFKKHIREGFFFRVLIVFCLWCSFHRGSFGSDALGDQIPRVWRQETVPDWYPAAQRKIQPGHVAAGAERLWWSEREFPHVQQRAHGWEMPAQKVTQHPYELLISNSLITNHESNLIWVLTISVWSKMYDLVEYFAIITLHTFPQHRVVFTADLTLLLLFNVKSQKKLLQFMPAVVDFTQVSTGETS